MEKSRLPYGGSRRGRSDLGGEHTCGPEQEAMTAASRRAPYCNRCTGCATRRPSPNEGKADVVEEETGRCTPRAAGGGVQARREGCAESTSGRSSSPQGLKATGSELGFRVPPRPEEGGGLANESVRAMTAGSRLLTWSMRSRQVREHLACAKGLWALGRTRSPRTCRAGEQWRARGSKPARTGVYVDQHFSFVRAGKATDGEPRSAPDWGHPTVRDRREACGNVDHGGTRHPPRLSKERVLETLRLKLCAPQIYPDRGLGQQGTGLIRHSNPTPVFMG